MDVTETIDTAMARDMVRAKSIRGASIVGRAGGWSVVLKHGKTEKALAAQRSRQVRVWRSLDRCVDYLKTELGIARIDALDARQFGSTVSGRQRPDRAAALRRAHRSAAYDTWLRSEIAAAIDDPRPSLSHEAVKRRLSAKRAALRRRLANRKSGSA